MKLLLDEHIWPGVAELVKRQIPEAEVESIHHYADGSLMNTTDNEVLAEAHRDGWTLVTFDLNTIPRLLSEKTMASEDHSGIVFISSKSFAQNDHARLAQALSVVARSEAAADWTNRVMFLSRKETTQSQRGFRASTSACAVFSFQQDPFGCLVGRRGDPSPVSDLRLSLSPLVPSVVSFVAAANRLRSPTSGCPFVPSTLRPSA